MNEIEIRKGDNYYSLSIVKSFRIVNNKRKRRNYIFLSASGGEGMEVGEQNMPHLYDAIDKFFEEYF